MTSFLVKCFFKCVFGYVVVLPVSLLCFEFLELLCVRLDVVLSEVQLNVAVVAIMMMFIIMTLYCQINLKFFMQQRCSFGTSHKEQDIKK